MTHLILGWAIVALGVAACAGIGAVGRYFDGP
jgi:hypothetical protein